MNILDTFILKISSNRQATGKYVEPREYALEVAQNELLISSLIQYISLPRDYIEEDVLRDIIAEILGQVGGIAIKPLIKLYKNSPDNPSARFYATYALAEHLFCQSGQISNEVHQILLDALQDNEYEIRNIVSSLDNFHHCAKNIYPWIKYFYLEYQKFAGDECGWAALIEVGGDYFKHATPEEIQQLEELLGKANEDEIRGISIAVSFIGSKNVSYLVRQLLLTVKEEYIRELLIRSLGHHNNLEFSNLNFLENLITENLTTQQTFRIQNSIENTIKGLKERETAKTQTKRRKRRK
ncbi:MAG TPA: hypothetical protein EYP59_21635 [Thiotrichaceae bacterium]|nr:hypothetical protein [Thiotrichaceae bacterium]